MAQLGDLGGVEVVGDTRDGIADVQRAHRVNSNPEPRNPRRRLRKTRKYSNHGITTHRHASTAQETSTYVRAHPSPPRMQSSQQERERTASETTSAKEVVVAVDFGTNNSIVAVSIDGKQRYVTTYKDFPSFLNAGPLVPSLLQYDDNNERIRYGHQVSPGDTGVLQWFKLALSADDNSGVWNEAVKQISDRGLTEEEVATTFLTRLFEAVRDHLCGLTLGRPLSTAYVLDVLAAQPSQGDALGQARYEDCLTKAATAVGFRVRSVHVWSEIRAVVRSCVPSTIDLPSRCLFCVHDGGGGTTHFQTNLVSPGRDGSVQQEQIHVPLYLPVGGEATDVRFEKFVRDRYPALSAPQWAACMRLWRMTLKIKDSDNWVLDAEAKSVLPPEFALDDSFCEGLEHEVFAPALGEIFEYLCREFDAGKRMALERYEARLHEYPVRTGRPRPSIWDHEADESDDPDESVTSPLGTVERLEQAFDRAYPTVVISHGGQIANRRLQTMLQARFGEQWRCAEEPRAGVVDGLMHLYTDLKAGRWGGAWARHAYGYMGWQETTKSRANGVRYNEDLQVQECLAPAYVVHLGSDISIGSLHRRPGRDTSRIRERPRWPEEIVIRQFTAPQVRAWKEDGMMPLEAREILVLRPPRGPVAEELVVLRRYAKDRTSGALHFRAVEYQVRLVVDPDGLRGQLVVCREDSRDVTVVVEEKRTFDELGLTLDDL
ncbi:hypothetical protein LTR92_010760 [Exophiala xenobiotica]|nr:hypothetical protein LTR92_010760 [Exophiala xenobiotica]KAK5247791.1 hypothetical protein LTS06_007094 [Exophiala xenobiotica]KAK5262065.1 hypothetical protein LTR40_000995 [Exophiala xenobiotica]